MFKSVLLIGLGSFTGGILRYLISNCIHQHPSSSFPYGTLVVNLAGCFAIGLFYGFAERFHLPTEVRLFLTTGLCGGFTTFSTFSNDGVCLLKEELYGTFVLYTLSSIVIGLTATLVGGYIGKQI